MSSAKEGISALERGIIAYRKGAFADALRFYRSYLSYNPDDADAWNAAAVAAGRCGELGGALAFMARAFIGNDMPARLPMLATNTANIVVLLSASIPSPLSAAREKVETVFASAVRLVLDIPASVQKGNVPWPLFSWTLVAAAMLRRSEAVLPIAERGIAIAGGTISWLPQALVIGLLDQGVIRDDLLRIGVRSSADFLRIEPTNAFSIYLLLYYAYFRNRPWLLGRLRRRLLDRIPTEALQTSHALLSHWHISDVHDDFFARIEAAPPTASVLMPMIGRRTAVGASLVVVTCCDARYWMRFGRRLVASLSGVAKKPFLLHVHIVDPTAETLDSLQAVAAAVPFPMVWTVELTRFLPESIRDRLSCPEFRRTYYACVRFLRMPEFMGRYAGIPILVIDTDAVCTADPFAIAAMMEGDRYDFCIPNGTRLGPTREFFCNVVHYGGSAASRRYADLVSRYIRYYFEHRLPLWMLDQAALFCCHAHLREKGEAFALNHFDAPTTGVAAAFAHVMTMDENEKHDALDALCPAPSPDSRAPQNVSEKGKNSAPTSDAHQDPIDIDLTAALAIQMLRTSGHGKLQAFVDRCLGEVVGRMRDDVTEGRWKKAAEHALLLQYGGAGLGGWLSFITQGLVETADIETLRWFLAGRIIHDPAAADIWVSMGVCEQYLGRFMAGAAALRRGLRLDPAAPRLATIAAVAGIHARIAEKCGATVQAGPFAGMIYRGMTALGVNPSRLLGAYEAELHETVETIVETGYDAVVNIGCAEGYYAVGLARRIPHTTVYAYDIDANALRLCREVIAANGVGDRIRLGGLFEPHMFAEFAHRRSIVLCDIEGAEDELLDGAALGALAGMDLLVEVHESARPGLMERLRRRFAATHDLHVIPVARDDDRRRFVPPGLDLTETERRLVLWERDTDTPWLHLRSHRLPAGGR